MGIEKETEINTQIKIDSKRIREISPTDILEQINRTLLYNFGDGNRSISPEEKLKLEETKEIVDEILNEKKNKLSCDFRGKNGVGYSLDLLTGIVTEKEKYLCRLSQNEKSFLYGLLSNPGKIMTKYMLNGIIYPEQKGVKGIGIQNNDRLWVIKERLVKKLGKELGGCILAVQGNGYLWDDIGGEIEK